MIMRPNGKPYHPRKITANAVCDEDETLAGVVVLGTHDLARAKALADEYAAWQIGSGAVAVDPLPGWYRDGFECGERHWVTDEEHGRAGIWFRKVAERGDTEASVSS